MSPPTRCPPAVRSAHIEPLESRRLLTVLPEGFIEQRVVNGIADATAMAIAPDGRIFVAEQNGNLRVIRNGQLLAQPFVTVQTDFFAERGLVGVTLDPDFENNGYVYVYYVTAWGLTPAPPHGRVSRFTANGDVAIPGSELVLASADWASPAAIHNGGAMKFGPDGKLYVAVGDNSSPLDAQSLTAFAGKILRINPDGSIPADNPFPGVTDGPYRAIYARGFRNPFTLDIHPDTGRILVNDVGQVTWEEVNDVSAGGNYGWPATEGDFDPLQFPDFQRPLYAYPHNNQDSAIAGAAFYAPVNPTFPAEYLGDYFFGDFVHRWIGRLDFANPNGTGAFTFQTFATEVSPFLVDIEVGHDGNLYYLTRSDGAVWRVRFASDVPPEFAEQPHSTTVPVGLPATFSVIASGTGPLQYQWQRDGIDIPGATGPTLTLPVVSLDDDGAVFRCVVSNAFGSILSDEATLTVVANQPPVPQILAPAEGTLYTAGDTITFTGLAIDPETGGVNPASYEWSVVLHHDTHTHPFIPSMPGIFQGEFTIPNTGHVEANVWYRIHFSATDPQGFTGSTFLDLHPRTANVSLGVALTAGDAGSLATPLNLLLDGTVHPTPHDFLGVAGVIRLIEAPLEQTIDGQTYVFQQWTDDVPTAQRTLVTPATDLSLGAVYRDITPPRMTAAAFYYEPPALGPGTPLWAGVEPPPHRLELQFSEDVWNSVAAAGAAAFEIRRVSDGWLVPDASKLLAWHAPTRTVTLWFTNIPGGAGTLPDGALPDGDYVLVPPTTLADATGNPIVEPDGLAFFVLHGDANRDRTVGIADFAALAGRFNAPGRFADGDFDYDGHVDIADFSILAARFNVTLNLPDTQTRPAGNSARARASALSPTPLIPRRATPPATPFSRTTVHRLEENLRDQPDFTLESPAPTL